MLSINSRFTFWYASPLYAALESDSGLSFFSSSRIDSIFITNTRPYSRATLRLLDKVAFCSFQVWLCQVFLHGLLLYKEVSYLILMMASWRRLVALKLAISCHLPILSFCTKYRIISGHLCAAKEQTWIANRIKRVLFAFRNLYMSRLDKRTLRRSIPFIRWHKLVKFLSCSSLRKLFRFLFALNLSAILKVAGGWLSIPPFFILAILL